MHTISWTQLMKDGAHPSPLAALSFSGSKKVPIYCWVESKSFLVVKWMAKPGHGFTTFLRLSVP